MGNDRDKVSCRLVRVVTISIIFLLGAACTSPQPALVSDRAQPPTKKLQSHLVSKGETLYSIAWRYGLDHQKLAAANNINPPYTIYPNQRLRLAEAEPGRRVASSQSSIQKPTQPAGSAVKPSSGRGAPEKRSENQTKISKASPVPALIQGAPQWRWPADGRILSAFGASTGLNKGIDIEGDLGEPVIAAASGQVVYAGSGLRGYGKLLIIKHNDTYLSAYAHNDRLLLSEGDAVKGGDKIAEMGSSGTDSVKLHFEIRRQGEPVDPIRYLPKR